MFEGILHRYSFTGVDTSGEKVGGFDLPASAGVTYVIVGHTEPLELVHEGGAGDTLPIPAGLTVISGPYRDASGGAPRLIRSTGASTDVDVIAVREEGSNFRHEPLGDVVRIDDADPVDVELDYIEGEALALTGQGSAQPVPFEAPDGTELTRSLSGVDGLVDIRPFTEATVAADAAVNGGSDSTTAVVEGLRTRSASIQSLNSLSIAPGDGEQQVFRGDVSDLSWLRTTEDSAGSDHSFFLVLK